MRILLKTLALLPRPLAQWFGQLVGLVNFHLNTRSTKVTRVNLALCCPGETTESLVRASLIETGRTMMETPAVWLGELDDIDDWIAEVKGEQLLKDAVASEQGLLMLLPHTGNWELFNVFFRRYGQMTALYHPPRVQSMHSIMAEVRARHGNEMVPTTRSGLSRLFRVLKEGGTVVVLPDQVPASGVYVPFFGQMALTDPLSTRLIRRTGARVLGIAITRRPDGRFDVQVREPPTEIYSADNEVALAAVNRLVEDFARLDLAQYQWEYKRFRERPAGEIKVYRFGKEPSRHR